MFHASWYSHPCVVPSHTVPVGLYDQWNMVEGMGCHFYDYVIKDWFPSLLHFSPPSFILFSPISFPLCLFLPRYWIIPLGEAICRVWAAPWRGPLGEELKSDNNHMSGSRSSNPSQAFKLQLQPKLQPHGNHSTKPLSDS